MKVMINKMGTREAKGRKKIMAVRVSLLGRTGSEVTKTRGMDDTG